MIARSGREWRRAISRKNDKDGNDEIDLLVALGEQLLGRRAERQDLRFDVQLAHPSVDHLAVLGARVQDRHPLRVEHAVEVCGRRIAMHSSPFARLLHSSSRLTPTKATTVKLRIKNRNY